jgi:hypothetical protein
VKSAQAESGVSVVNLSKRIRDCCCRRCAESERLNTWGVVEGRARGVYAKSLKESEWRSSGGIAPSWCRQGKAPEVVRGRLKNEFQVKGLEG